MDSSASAIKLTDGHECNGESGKNGRKEHKKAT